MILVDERGNQLYSPAGIQRFGQPLQYPKSVSLPPDLIEIMTKNNQAIVIE
jgi:hypothetical protein